MVMEQTNLTITGARYCTCNTPYVELAYLKCYDVQTSIATLWLKLILLLEL